VVEGFGTAAFDNSEYHRLHIGQYTGGRNAKRADACDPQPFISRLVSRRLVPSPVDLAIDLNSQSRRFAVEIQHVGTRGMLTAEFEIAGPCSQGSPQQHFRQGHCPPKRSRSSDGSLCGSEHAPCIWTSGCLFVFKR
jgi:hypothetical protein